MRSIVFFAAWAVLAGVDLSTRATQVIGAEDLERRVIERSEEAERLRKSSDSNRFEAIERIRRERWEDVAKMATDPKSVGSPWVIGFTAIRSVDGDQSISAAQIADPGLLNKLAYREACDTLRNAWAEMTKKTDGPVLGEVATRLYEVSQQSCGCYKDALNPDSPHFVADLDEVKRILAEARERDPCCIMASPMLFCIEKPDPTEAFLRAELRKSFKSRQYELVDISHPVIVEADKNGGNLKVREGADFPLLPWHGPVELAKAQSLTHLLEEIDYGSYLKPDVSGPGYVVPGKVIVGRDSGSEPFALLYGRFLFCRVADRTGRPRAAMLFLNENQQWERRYLDLLWRTPRVDEVNPLKELVESLPAQREFKLSSESFAIRDFPVDSAESFVRAQVQQLCVKSVSQLAALRYSPRKNDVRDVKKLESTRQDTVYTTPYVAYSINDFITRNDQTKHPLVELMNDAVCNPLLVISESDVGVRKESFGPSFLYDADQRPYLNLDDGQRLYFDMAGGADSPRCYVEYPGATAYMPLHFRSVPLNLLKGGQMGAAFFSLLNDAGYDDDSALTEVRECLERPEHVPPLFRKRLEARARSTRSSRSNAMSSMLSEKGWHGGPVLTDQMRYLYERYGFRYLRDKRGNWLTSHAFGEDQGMPAIGAQAPAAVAGEEPDKVSPFDFRAQDGAQRIDMAQVYTWGDYNQIKSNVYVEHLTKLLSFQPCFPVMDVISADASRMLSNPSDISADKPGDKYKKEYDAWLASNDSLATTKIPSILASPYPLWACGNDGDQAATLNNLHNEYVGRIQEAAALSRKMQGRVIAFRMLSDYETAFTRVPEERKKFRPLRESLESSYNAGQRQWFDASMPVIATQLECARYFAKAKLFHKSMVHYNDLILQQFVPQGRRVGLGTLEGVATTAEAEKYASHFESMVNGQRILVTAQVELAGVLNAAGLPDSAHYLWQRVCDDNEFFVKPAGEIVRDTVTSYGLRLSRKATEAMDSFEAAASVAREALDRYRITPRWRVCVTYDAPEKSELLSAIRQYRAIIGEKGNDLVDNSAEEKRLLGLVDREKTVDFETWLSYRQAMAADGGPDETRRRGNGPEVLLHPVQFCPRLYVEKQGFIRPVRDVVQGSSADDIREWCKLDDEQAFESADAANACYLLGWYWLEEGNMLNAREAFVKLSGVLIRQARRAVDAKQRLTLQLSSISAALGATAVFQDLPGVMAVRSGFGSFLTPQLLRLEREWFAASLYGPHASAECRVLQRQVDMIQDRALTVDASWRSGRFFFPDYKYVFGAVPDWLAFQAFTSPELFKGKGLTAEQVAELRKLAVEGNRWALLTPDDTKRFYDELVLDLQVNKDVVGLRVNER